MLKILDIKNRLQKPGNPKRGSQNSYTSTSTFNSRAASKAESHNYDGKRASFQFSSLLFKEGGNAIKHQFSKLEEEEKKLLQMQQQQNKTLHVDNTKQNKKGTSRSGSQDGRHKSDSDVSDGVSMRGILWFRKNLQKRRERKKKRLEAQKITNRLEALRLHKLWKLKNTAARLMKPGLGIFAADDSLQQLGERLNSISLSNTEDNRRRYHEVLFGGEGNTYYMDECISGVLVREDILKDGYGKDKKVETMIHDRHLILGIRMDGPVERIAGSDREFTTSGLDSLQETIGRVKNKGAEFALWRVVYRPSDFTPSKLALHENSRTLTKFASICQQHSIVPILATDVLPEGCHGYEDAQAITKEILTTLMKSLSEYKVFLKGLLIRITPAVPGPKFKGIFDANRVAASTMKAINQSLPPGIGGVMLARDNDLARSTSILNQMQKCPIRKATFVTFCYSLVIQDGVISIWAGRDKNITKAREELIRRAKICGTASMGQHSSKETDIFNTAGELRSNTLDHIQSNIAHHY